MKLRIPNKCNSAAVSLQVVGTQLNRIRKLIKSGVYVTGGTMDFPLYYFLQKTGTSRLLR